MGGGGSWGVGVHGRRGFMGGGGSWEAGVHGGWGFMGGGGGKCCHSVGLVTEAAGWWPVLCPPPLYIE